jgi:3-hydroxyisobutyrate dehydrogenase-like beta-hydroxyacid dehydrogenase
MNDVSVIGLGAMGATIAKLFNAKHRRVTVWNRTAGKASAPALAGVSVAPSAEAAVAASGLTVMCVYDYAAAKSIFASAEVAKAIAGKTIVHLTTGSPSDARELAEWASLHGATYLDGAIQAAPSQMGTADTPILISGDQAAFEKWHPVLNDLAGNFINLGAKVDAAATMDLSTLSYVYGAFVGFVQGALIAESEGLDVGQFGALVSAISPSFGAFFAHEGKVIESGDFRITESPLRISVEATQRIDAFSKDRQLNTEFSELAHRLLQRAHAAGLGDEEVAALIKVMRR